MGKNTFLALTVVVGSLIVAPTRGHAFMQALPEELKDKPEQEQLNWLNAEFDEAYTLQLKVAQERHEQRQARKDAVVQSLADQAFERESLVEEAEAQTREELEQAARQANVALGGLVACAALLALGVWWRRRAAYLAEVATVSPRVSREQFRRETEESLQNLTQKNKR